MKTPLFLLALSLSLIQPSIARNEDAAHCDLAKSQRAPFAGGFGTPERPYGICTLQQLKAMESAPGASYELWSDLDASQDKFVPLFSDEVPFSGTLNGMSHTVSNLNIILPDQDNVAPIRSCLRCSIRSLNLNHVTIVGRNSVASLIGYYAVETDGIPEPIEPKMENISIQGSVTGASNAGGVFGMVYYVRWLLNDSVFAKRQVSFDGTINGSSYTPSAVNWISGGYDYD